ncbi:SSA_2305 family type IV pilus system protein [Streptococcus panodentis]|uniref:MFS transporter n=1 Tax=Streptococcus panodentis TaxID=1581472 RepID=A0ABS5AUQ3_9STRE|nr:MFS transporter [Streptococcus panodentis]MBP2620312.1 MFS transporter [Streptococcus panodentis]
MTYFLPFGAGLIALHTISILLVTKISLLKRLFLVVWVVLFVIGAPFLFQYLPSLAFVGVCALAVIFYFVLLFAQELSPARKKSTLSARSRRHAKGRRRKAEMEDSEPASSRELNFAAAPTGRKRKERSEGMQFEDKPAKRTKAAEKASSNEPIPIRSDMKRHDKPNYPYSADNLAEAPVFEEYDSSGRKEPAASEGGPQSASDEFLESLLHLRKGSTKVKVANSLLSSADVDGSLNDQGFTDINDPIFETAVLSKIRPTSYAESDYGGIRPQLAGVSEMTGVISREPAASELASQESLEAPAREEAASSLEDFFAASEVSAEASERSQADTAAAEPVSSLESLFFADSAAAESAASQPSPAADLSAQADWSRDSAEIQEYQDILSQIQLDLLGPAEEAAVFEDPASAAEMVPEPGLKEAAAESEPAGLQSAVLTEAVSETELSQSAAAAFAAADIQPADEAEIAAAAVSEPLEPAATAVSEESEEDLLKEIAELLQAEEAAVQRPVAPSAAAPAAPAEESEEDLLKEIAGILGGSEESSQPAASPKAEHEEVYYQFLLLESQELVASDASQEAAAYLQEILSGSTDQKVRQEAFKLLDKIGKI